MEINDSLKHYTLFEIFDLILISSFNNQKKFLFFIE